ncbi:hypothetical protein HC891_17050 [Candidatus Gracilibacteria bacterium]|nr:hypothetical protein [Candidatus Gracilibacteria bacterium]
MAPSITIVDPVADSTVVNGFAMRGTATFYPSDADLEYRVLRRDTGAQIGAGFFFLQNNGGPPFNWSVQIFFDASYSGPIQVEVTDIDRSSGAVYARTAGNYTAQATGQGSGGVCGV